MDAHESAVRGLGTGAPAHFRAVHAKGGCRPRGNQGLPPDVLFQCSGSFCKVVVRTAMWSDVNGSGSLEPCGLRGDHAQCSLLLSQSLSWLLASFAPRMPLGRCHPALSRAHPT